MEKYLFTEAPSWADKITDPELVKRLKYDSKIQELKNSGRRFCFLFNNIFYTSNEKNVDYLMMVWYLRDTDDLQGASISEFFLTEHQSLNIHRMAIVREGVLIDKTKDLTIRVFDDERSSSFGSINKTKKIHCVVGDVRLGDIFLLEYSIVTVFGEKNVLDKNYVRYIRNMPNGYWFYENYTFKLIQDRDEEIVVNQKYFRDETDKKISIPQVFLKRGENFIFSKVDFQTQYVENYYTPYIQLATNTSWNKISSYIYSLYEDSLRVDLKNLQVYTSLGLDKGDNIEIKIQKIIEFVQNQIIYLYDAEVMHGHIPQASSVTLDLKSGDCKAKALLLVNLLSTIGINSTIILIHYDEDLRIEENLPSPFAFNHSIVRIEYLGKDYFVDPTWIDKSGSLQNRSQPFFTQFLPIKDNSTLQIKNLADVYDFNVEVGIDIELKENKAIIMEEVLYRREQADFIRNEFSKQDMAKNIRNENDYFLRSFSVPNKDASKMFSDVTYKIISDDTTNNELRVRYQSKADNPFHPDKVKIFKFWHNINFDRIINYNHKDELCVHFCAFPIKYKVKIKSDMFIDKRSPIIKNKEFKIENDYFKFLNKKLVSFKSIEVISEYIPKNYRFIKSDDLENVKKDYLKINDNNFGVGIKYLTLWQYLFTNPFFITLISILWITFLFASHF